MIKKILIGCPTSNYHEYALPEYAKALKALTYPNFDILLVDNSKDDKYKKKIESYGLPVIKGPWFESARDRIVASRNILRQKALDEGYDYFFSLEQDVLPPENVLERLLSAKKRLLSGIYFTYLVKNNKKGFFPLIWTKSEKDNYYVMKLSELNRGIRKIASAGLGCVLIHKSILKDIKFRYDKTHPGFDDIHFYLDCKTKNLNIYADTNLICQHLIKNRPWNWEDIQN